MARAYVKADIYIDAEAEAEAEARFMLLLQTVFTLKQTHAILHQCEYVFDIRVRMFFGLLLCDLVD
jgi:hypothetical protein